MSLILFIGPADAWGKSLLDEDETLSSVYDVLACSYGAIHCISCNDVRSALELYPEEYDKIKYDLVLSFDITRQVRFLLNWMDHDLQQGAEWRLE